MNVESLSTPLCGPLKPLLTKVTRMLYILGIPSLDGRIQNVAMINGGKRLFKTVAVRSPGLLTYLLELLLGPGSTLTDLMGLIGGLTEGVGKTVKELTSGIGDFTETLSGVTEGVGKTLGSLTPEVGGVTGTVGGITGGLGKNGGGLTSGVGEVSGMLGGVTGGSIGGLTSGLTGATDLVGGLTGSLVDSGVTEMLGDVAEGIGDTAAELTNTLGEATNGLGGVVGILNTVPEVTKAVSGLTGEVVKTVESVANGLVSPSGVVGGLTGILGTGLLGGTNKSGFSTTESLGNKNLLGNDVAEGIKDTAAELTNTLGEATNGLGGVVGILNAVPEVTKAVSGLTDEVVKTVESVANGLVSPSGVVGGLTGILGTGLLGGTNKSGFSTTESLGNKNLLGNDVAEGIKDTAAELTNTLGEATNGLGGVVGILNAVPEVTKAVSGLTGEVVKTVESVANGLVSPSGVVGGLTGILGTGLLGGTNKSGFSTTESLGNKNLLGNDGIANSGGELTGGAAGRISARPDLRRENSVLTAQQNAAASGSLRVDASGGYNRFNADTSGGLLQGGAFKTGGSAGGLLGGSLTRKFNSLFQK
ncbi:mucin-19-like isoform X2 [Hyla sarda]|nr:mucin-19-like isoform X2 [Hyla sarda]